MKTLSKTFCFLVIFWIVMVSCDKEIEQRWTIIGSWEYINENYTVIDPHGRRNYRLLFQYTFNPDSTGFFYYECKSKDNNRVTDTLTNYFSYNTNNNLLTLTSTKADSSTITEVEYIIDQDKLTLYHDPYTLVYTRK
jgi:hypothetical protein